MRLFLKCFVDLKVNAYRAFLVRAFIQYENSDEKGTLCCFMKSRGASIMANKKRFVSCCRFPIFVVAMISFLAFSELKIIACQDVVDQKSPATLPSDKRPSAKSTSKEKSQTAKSAEELRLSAQQKKMMALSTIDEVLAAAHKITPVEQGVLVQVEAATLLWRFDKDRSFSILASAVESLRKLLDDEKSDKGSRRLTNRQQMFRASILRRIARLSPDVLKRLLDSADDNRAESLFVSTPEAWAILQTAEQMIGEDMEAAIKLAEQSLSFGLGGWTGFLMMLNNRDSQRAQQMTFSLIDRLRESSTSPSNFQMVNLIVFGRDVSVSLQDHYFRSLAARLRRDIRPDLSARELKLDMITARQASSLAARVSPQWRAAFEEIAASLDALHVERYQSGFTAPRSISIDTSAMEGAKSADTREIEEAGSKTNSIRDSRSRDKEYQGLAASAALRADVRVAEDMLSKIENDDVRRETTVMVYGPLAQKALSDADWSLAHLLASKITDPLARTIILDQIARRCPQTKEGKQKAKEIYDSADAQLRRDLPSEAVAKAYLILAASLLQTDPPAGIEAARSAVYALNKAVLSDDEIENSAAINALAPWITLSGPSFSHSEALEITELISPLFKEMTKRNADEAQAIAYGLKHQGLYSLAQLGIAKEMLEEAAVRKPSQHKTSR